MLIYPNKKNTVRYFSLVSLLALLIFSSISCDDHITNTSGYTVTKITQRRENDYTQGIFLNEANDIIFQSGGLYKKSVLRKMKYPSLETISKIDLPDKFFGEGIAKCLNKIYMLTWRERKVLVYSYPEIEFDKEFEMDPLMQEGWGLSNTDNADELMATDGSDQLFYLDCNNNLKVKSRIKVTIKTRPVNYLNDLAWANGFIYANIYFNNSVIKIDPRTGVVLRAWDFTPLVNYESDHSPAFNAMYHTGDVLNGIEYENDRDIFVMTGKRWQFFYEVKFSDN